MVHRVLLIGRWMVDFLFAVRKYDIEGVLSVLYNAHAPESIIDDAEELMRSCEYNCGFTYSNPRRKLAVVLIGPTTSGAEFIDTLVHEVHHLAVAIASSIGVDLEGETPAYLAGDASRELMDVICSLGCDNKQIV